MEIPCPCSSVFALLMIAVGSLAAGAVMVAEAHAADEEQLPQVQVTAVRRVFHNGEHNAFTDLVRFRGKFWLTFRSCPDGHGVSPTASIIILASDDARDWRPVHRFRVALRDTRDPHFLVFQDKLFRIADAGERRRTDLAQAGGVPGGRR